MPYLPVTKQILRYNYSSSDTKITRYNLNKSAGCYTLAYDFLSLE